MYTQKIATHAKEQKDTIHNEEKSVIRNWLRNNIDDRFSRLGPSHSCYNYNPYVQEDRWKVEHVK